MVFARGIDIDCWRGDGCSHLVQLAAGRSDLLDAQLAELSLELAELLHQIILALVPKLDGLNLARRLEMVSISRSYCSFPTPRRDRNSPGSI